MKTFFVMVTVFFTGTVIGFYFSGRPLKNEIREELYQSAAFKIPVQKFSNRIHG